MFICLEGIDGAGKTSTAAELSRRLAGQGDDPVLIRKGTVHQDHPMAARRFAAIGRGTWRPSLDNEVRELGYLPWILFNATYYAALADALVLPALGQGRSVIVDGWYYKFALRAAIVEARPIETILALFGQIRVPDRVILLDVPPTVAAARLRGFTENETGNGTEPGLSGTPAFVAFQNQIRARLLAMADVNRWTVLDGHRDRPSILADRIVKSAREHGTTTRKK